MRRYLEEVKQARRNVTRYAEQGAVTAAPAGSAATSPPVAKRSSQRGQGPRERTPWQPPRPDAEFELVTVPVDLASLPSSCNLSGLAIEFECHTIDDLSPAGRQDELTSGVQIAEHLPAVAELSADVADYHEAARNLVARLPRNSPSLVLMVAADDTAYSPHMVARLLGALAEVSDDPVLAVDCSREGALTGHFGIASNDRLAELAAGGTSWQDSIVQTPCPGLCILPLDSGSETPAADDLGRLYEAARLQYPLVAVDAGSFSEPWIRELAKVCQACFLVVRRDVTRIATAIGLREELASCGAALLGSVLLACSDQS